MSSKSTSKSKKTWRKASPRRVAHEAEGAASGMLAGAVVGAAAGPPGVVAGTILGGFAGAITGAALDNESRRQAAHTRELDAEIGVSEGDIGVATLEHPPATRGVYSAASAGVGGGSSGSAPAEGPMTPPED